MKNLLQLIIIFLFLAISTINQAQTYAPVATITTGLAGAFNEPDGVAVSGGLLYVPNFGSDIVEVLNATTYAPVATITTGLAGAFNKPSGVAVSGGLLYVPNSGSDIVEVLNATTYAPVATITTPSQP